MKKLKIFTDGGSRNNPGPAGIGFLIYDEAGEIIMEDGRYIGTATNNEAEYSALVEALKEAKSLSGQELEVFMDSELIIRQLNGIYKVKDEKMKRLFDEVQVLKMGFVSVKFEHIKRELNKRADFLVNKALDEAMLK